MTNLHGALVHKEAVELDGSIAGTGRFAENNGRNATADSIWSIGDGNTLDGTNGFDKVFLYAEKGF